MQLIDLLPHKKQGIISITGAGGKTSIMFHLAKQFAGSGLRVLTTSTTKIYPPTSQQSEVVIVAENAELTIEEIRLKARTHQHISALSSYTEEKNKLVGFPPDEINIFQESRLFDRIIVEADGAAGRSLKFPADHEPVIPQNTAIWIGVIGLDILGLGFSEERVFRSSLVMERSNFQQGQMIDEDFITKFSQLPKGITKGVPEKTFACLFLNKADTPMLRDSGQQIGKMIQKQQPKLFDLIMVGQADKKLIIHQILT